MIGTGILESYIQSDAIELRERNCQPECLLEEEKGTSSLHAA